MNNLLLAILTFVLTHPIHAEIRLASFYAGEISVDSNLERIADIIQLFDLVAIQGLRETESIDPLVSILFRRGDYYKFLVSNPTGNNGRRYAFAWRDKTIQISSPPTFLETQLQHQALTTTFRSNNFNFTAINYQSLSTKENNSTLVNTYLESSTQTPHELDIILFAALPTETLPKLTPLVQVTPKHSSDLEALNQLFPAIYLDKKNTIEYTGNAQQIDPEQLVFDSNKNTLHPCLGWAEFDNNLIDDDPTLSLIKNDTWGKTKNRSMKVVPSVK